MEPKLHKTRYPELRYTNDAPGLWRIVDAEEHRIGRHYPSKSELLRDLDRYAFEYGCSDAVAPPTVNTELIEALKACYTEPGANCIVTNDVAYMIRRFKAINEIVQNAISKTVADR